MLARKHEKERELLYSWAPGTQKKTLSKRFERMMDRFINPHKRQDEKRKQKKEVDNAKFWAQAAKNHANGAVKM